MLWTSRSVIYLSTSEDRMNELSQELERTRKNLIQLRDELRNLNLLRAAVLGLYALFLIVLLILIIL